MDVGDGAIEFDGESGYDLREAVGPLGVKGNPSAQGIVTIRELRWSVGYDEQNGVDETVGDEAGDGIDALDESVAAEENIASLVGT